MTNSILTHHARGSLLATVYWQMITALGCFCFVFSSSVIASTQQLYNAFESPPQHAKPFARWWWNGNCVEKDEIIRELEVLKAAGFGGIEINPIGMPVIDVQANSKCHQWLSDDWNALFKMTIEEANKRGLASDIIVGSGWPFGGEFLEEDELLQGIGINSIEVKGPMLLERDVKSLLVKPGEIGREDKAYKNAGEPELMFLNLVSRETKQISQVIDLMSHVDANGILSYQVKDGTYDLYVGTFQNGFRKVTVGAPGADGPVLDHYNEQAVRRYLDRMSLKLTDVFGDKLGEQVRSVFCDSIELSGANWNQEFANKFKQRNGYDVHPWLPFVIQYGYGKKLREYKNPKLKDYGFNYTPEFNDQIKRARYDFNQTLIEVYNNAFVKVFHEWSNEQGLKSRYQAYGNPWLIGISEGNLLVDIPESNNWLFRTPRTSWIWNIYATSGANISGKSEVAVEAMTNTKGVFQTTLEQIKHADDDNFISGINHSVIHGFNYSPPEAGFPGWVRYGTYFSEQNTWWPYVTKWTKYNARLSAVFQEATPLAQVAILAPFADRYSETGLVRDPIQFTPPYVHALWRSLSQLGMNTNYLNEDLIQQSKVENGSLHIGKMRYQVLLIPGVKSIQADTAEALEKIAQAGVEVIFINELPHRSPGFMNAKQNDEAVQNHINAALKFSKVSRKELPQTVINDIRNDKTQPLTLWSQTVLADTNIQSPVEVINPRDGLFQRHARVGDNLVVFFSNQNKDSSVNATIKFNDVSDLVPWIWSPETGQRIRHAFNRDEQTVALSLKPVESMLIVFDVEQANSIHSETQNITQKDGVLLDAPWEIAFKPRDGKSFELKQSSLINFAMSDNKAIHDFAGQVIYEAKLELQNGSILDLNDVSGGVTEVYINDKKLGTNWYGDHHYVIENAHEMEPSRLKIVYTSTLVNEVISMQGTSKVARHWTGKFSSPMQQGILGPIMVYK